MDLVRLDSETFLPVPGGLVQDYSSIIWTDRFPSGGDIQVTGTNVQYLKEKLPLRSLVGVLGHREVMIIEDYVEETDDNGIVTLKVVGSSFDTFLKERVTARYTKKGKWPMQVEYSRPRAVAAYVWNAVVSTSSTDRTGKESAGSVARKPEEAVPNLGVVLKLNKTYSGRKHILKPSVVYNQMLDMMEPANLGIRTERPTGQGSERKFVSLDPDGTFVQTTVSNSQKMVYVIYDTLDRSASQLDRPAVIFRKELGDVGNSTELTSSATLKNVSRVLLPTGQKTVNGKGVLDEYASGLGRLVKFVDLSEADEGEIGFGDSDFSTFTDSINTGFAMACGTIYNASDKANRDQKARDDAIERGEDLVDDFLDFLENDKYYPKVVDRKFKKLFSDLHQTGFGLVTDIVEKGGREAARDDFKVSLVNIMTANKSLLKVHMDVADQNIEDFMVEKGRLAVRRSPIRRRVTGSVTTKSNHKYGVDYFLGDIVTIEGSSPNYYRTDYRVTEYILAEDENGEVSYPGFTEIIPEEDV